MREAKLALGPDHDPSDVRAPELPIDGVLGSGVGRDRATEVTFVVNVYAWPAGFSSAGASV